METCGLMHGVSSLRHLPRLLSHRLYVHTRMEKFILMRRVPVKSRLVFPSDNRCPLYSISNFHDQWPIWVKQTYWPCYRDTHTNTYTQTKTQSQVSPFIIVTNSAGIPSYNRPILFGVTDRSGTWKAGIGHSQCGRKRIRDQHCSVSGEEQRLYVCAATVRVGQSTEARNWRRKKWNAMRRREGEFQIQTL